MAIVLPWLPIPIAPNATPDERESKQLSDCQEGLESSQAKPTVVFSQRSNFFAAGLSRNHNQRIYSIVRIPVPFDLVLELQIWTTGLWLNLETKRPGHEKLKTLKRWAVRPQ